MILCGHKYIKLNVLLYFVVAKAPTVLLLFSGSPVQIQWAQESKHVTAILQCFLPGQSAGDAIFNSLTARTPSDVPAGRLPFTWPKSLDKVGPSEGITIEDMKVQIEEFENKTMIHRSKGVFKLTETETVKNGFVGLCGGVHIDRDRDR